MKLTLRIWRQASPTAQGRFETFDMPDVSPDMSFLEMLDVLNGRLETEGREPIAVESDCREGICGACGLVIDGQPHGPSPETTTCQLHLRVFADGQTITIEPWRAAAFPVLKDLIVDRSAFDRVMQAGGYITVATGNAPEANAVPVAKAKAELAMDAAACIGCGACVAACRNASAMLFVGAKISHLAALPQGQPERRRRVQSMVDAMDAEGFGHCSNEALCEAACPKAIKLDNIARLNREYLTAKALGLVGLE